MARLFRPTIPVEVKCLVALRQVADPDLNAAPEAILAAERNRGALLALLLRMLAEMLGCTVKDLRLDHNPPLGARQRKGEGKKTIYDPPANSPAHLAYRPHGTQFDGSHDVKTRIRGDHGQYSDIVLVKRERRRQKKKQKKRRKWSSRPLRSASRWPKSRKIGGRGFK
jgi:hypothetical protein